MRNLAPNTQTLRAVCNHPSGIIGAIRKTVLSIPVWLALVVPSHAQFLPPAFPAAQGFGAVASGGRGGNVYYVTNLNATGPGSLQWALDQPGKKYVLFKVSGVIPARIELHRGNVTIAGQTSPGGITLRGFVTDESPYQDQIVRAPTSFAENWILRHVRIRPGTAGFSDDGLRLRYTRKAIVDHVSIGNATDEAVEISYSNEVTIQNSIIAETLGEHANYGGMLINYSNPAHGFALDRLSIHHNLWTRLEGRFPEVSRESAAAANSIMRLEISANLYWDVGYYMTFAPNLGAAGVAPVFYQMNLVNNRFYTRNTFPYGMFEDAILRAPGSARNRLFIRGNRSNLYGQSRVDVAQFYCCNDYATGGPSTAPIFAVLPNERNPFPAMSYHEDIRNHVYANVGAFPRDPMDRRLLGNIAQNRINTGIRNTNPAGDALRPAWTGQPPTPPMDTDLDGMPDAWETPRGLNPRVKDHNGLRLHPLYTNLEIYLNELAAKRPVF